MYIEIPNVFNNDFYIYIYMYFLLDRMKRMEGQSLKHSF